MREGARRREAVSRTPGSARGPAHGKLHRVISPALASRDLGHSFVPNSQSVWGSGTQRGRRARITGRARVIQPTGARQRFSAKEHEFHQMQRLLPLTTLGRQGGTHSRAATPNPHPIPHNTCWDGSSAVLAQMTRVPIGQQ